MKRLIFRELAW